MRWSTIYAGTMAFNVLAMEPKIEIYLWFQQKLSVVIGHWTWMQNRFDSEWFR